MKVFHNKIATYSDEELFVEEFLEFAVIYNLKHSKKYRIEIFSKRNSRKDFRELLNIKSDIIFYNYINRFKPYLYPGYQISICELNFDSLLELIQESECREFVNLIFYLDKILSDIDITPLHRNDFL